MTNSRKLTTGILAHVDAGKTTLSESMLHLTGAIREAGRVDRGDSFLDTDEREKTRGITIFSGQAVFELPAQAGAAGGGANVSTAVTLLDTPGHVDFAAEMERTLSVLDCAILVISARDGVQGHTTTLWKLLEQHGIPAFVFVNKMDMFDESEVADATRRILAQLQAKLSDGCQVVADFESLAECDEELLEEYLETGALSDASIAAAVKRRSIFPCYFGSALKESGVQQLLDGLGRYAPCTGGAGDVAGAGGVAGAGDVAGTGNVAVAGDVVSANGTSLTARVFRITRDDKGERLTHMKILSGTLSARDEVRYRNQAGEELSEKVNQIRIYSGSSFTAPGSVDAGTVCAVTGLTETNAGQQTPHFEAFLSYGLRLPEGANAHEVLRKLKQLQEEDPQLRITWNEQHQEIQVRLMGQVQLEVLQNITEERFGLNVEFDEGHITYRETIGEAVHCAGHFEPLRHYAEVHLLLEPLPAGSGLEFGSVCSTDDLDTNWQRLIMTHFAEREHPGVLTGSPITDMRITITGGRAHLKHTEGGDFRQSTYRAIRQGLMKSLTAGGAVLLEPWYDFELEVPQDMVGRAMTDVQRMGGECSLQDEASAGLGGAGTAILCGSCPVSEMRNYPIEVATYTKGFGRLTLSGGGYRPCHNQDEVVAASGYDPDRDVENPADSVFCSHGAGHNVAWNEADEMMHVKVGASRSSNIAPSVSASDDTDLERIFERTYGKAKTQKVLEKKTFESEAEKRKKHKAEEPRDEYLLVDGYNVIFAWEDLKELAKVNIDGAREALIEILNNYQGYKAGGHHTIAVFDAYKVSGGTRHYEQHDNVSVVFTREAETADTYIERATFELKQTGSVKHNVRVVTSDRAEQTIIIGNDGIKVSTADFRKEVDDVQAAIAEIIARHNRRNEIEHRNRIVLPEKK